MPTYPGGDIVPRLFAAGKLFIIKSSIIYRIYKCMFQNKKEGIKNVS